MVYLSLEFLFSMSTLKFIQPFSIDSDNSLELLFLWSEVFEMMKVFILKVIFKIGYWQYLFFHRHSRNTIVICFYHSDVIAALLMIYKDLQHNYLLFYAIM